MANTLTVDQISTILKAVVKQATGINNVASLNTKELLTIGQKSLATGYDPVMSAISQVISRTIFSNRPYSRKFNSIKVDEQRWGNQVRKLTVVEDETDLKDNDYLNLVDDASIDQYVVKKPKTLQLNFYGQQTYEIMKTIFDTQLDTAFNSEAEFGAFISMVFQYVYNKIEKIHEETARATVSGYIAGKIAGDAGNVIHLITEYNNETGSTLTSTTVYAPENFDPFMKWAYSKVESISQLMTEYSAKFHTNLTNGTILRHTPKADQRIYLYAPLFNQATTRVHADTFHESFLKMEGAEMVNYWQSINTPDKIFVTKPNYLNASGAIVASATDVEQANIFGVIFDKETLGYSPVLERTKSSPYNARGEYRNVFWKFNERHWIDFTENGVVFLLD